MDRHDRDHCTMGKLTLKNNKTKKETFKYV